jgi:hypothetical protein
MIFLISVLYLLMLADPGWAYIGPGAGFAFLSSFLVFIVSFILVGFYLLSLPLRIILKAIFRQLARVSPSVVGSSPLEIIFNPGEKPITKNPLIKRIEVGYPTRSIEIFGWRIHWLVLFFIFSIISGFAFKGVFGVEL